MMSFENENTVSKSLKHECECNKNGKSRIVRKFYSVKTNNYLYLSVPDFYELNYHNNQTYDLQWANSKIVTTIKIRTDCMRMHCNN